MRELPPESQDEREVRRRRGLRAHLRDDAVFFGMCLAFLAFTTWVLGTSWWLLRDPVLLVLTVLSVLAAFGLFYLRDHSSGGER